MKRIQRSLRGLPRWKSFNIITGFIRDLCFVVSVVMLVLVIIDEIWDGKVSDYLNLYYLLAVFVTTGILAILVSPWKAKIGVYQLGNWLYLYLLFAGSCGAVIIWHETRGAGWFSPIIVGAAAILVMYLSLLFLKEEDD